MLGHVLLVDTQTLLSDALAAELDRHSDLSVIDDRPSTGAEALEVAEAHQPDVALVDCWLPDVQGPAMVRMLLARLPACKVIVLSGFYSPKHIEDALLAGAVGFIPKTIRLDDLVQAIVDAQAGVYPVDAERLRKLRRTLSRRVEVNDVLHDRFTSLTPREVEVLNLLNQGRSTDEIADELHITVKTVTNHVQAILDKSGSSSRGQAVAVARNLAFVPPIPSRWMTH